MYFHRQTGLALGVLCGPQSDAPLSSPPAHATSFSGTSTVSVDSPGETSSMGSSGNPTQGSCVDSSSGVERRKRSTGGWEVDPRWMLCSLLQDGCELLRPLLTASDVICVRMACRDTLRLISLPVNDGYSVATQAALDCHRPLLRWAIVEAGCPTSLDTVRAAARGGMTEEVELMLRRSPEAVASALVGATEGGAQPGCDRLFRLLWIKSGQSLNRAAISRVSATVAATGSVAHAKIMAASGHRLSSRYLATAATSGSVPLLTMILAGRVPAQPQPIAAAAGAGHVEAVAWLRERGAPWDAEATGCAAAGGFVELLDWLVEHGCPIVGDEVALRAARNNHTNVLSWLAERPSLSWDAAAASTVAAQYRQWAAVLLIHSITGCLSPSTADAAAGDDNMEMLRFALDRGGKLTARGVRTASLHGHLAVLQFAHELALSDNTMLLHTPPLFDETTVDYALRGHRAEVVEYLYTIGCPGIQHSTTESRAATRAAHQSVSSHLSSPVSSGRDDVEHVSRHKAKAQVRAGSEPTEQRYAHRTLSNASPARTPRSRTRRRRKTSNQGNSLPST